MISLLFSFSEYHMEPEIDRYRYDSYDDNEDDELPRQEIQIGVMPFERIKNYRICRSYDNRGDDD